MHLETHHSISLCQKIVEVHSSEKHVMEHVVYTFWVIKEHQFFCCNLKAISYSTAQSPQKFKKHCSALKYWD